VGTRLGHLTPQECGELLAASTRGRIAVLVEGHPEIFPVNHVYDPATGVVAFPSNDRTKLHAALGEPALAFEVDGTDEEGWSGWSVLVVGRAEEITDPEQKASLADRRHVRWARDPGLQWVGIHPTKVTGRRIYYSL
jgi:nitroimidazol reductase NimA-like FMN-containing flavoprotein (pyridoxamine 5'-phosphate oxidase superfamily)